MSRDAEEGRDIAGTLRRSPARGQGESRLRLCSSLPSTAVNRRPTMAVHFRLLLTFLSVLFDGPLRLSMGGATVILTVRPIAFWMGATFVDMARLAQPWHVVIAQQTEPLSRAYSF